MESEVSKTEKTVLELDLMAYKSRAEDLEDQLGVEAVKMLEDQIQVFVDHGLQRLGLCREEMVLGTAGDNAILLFDEVAMMHAFAQTVQQETFVYNQAKSVNAERWFRMGAATGTVLVIPAERRIIGTTIARAVRLEAAAEQGQLVIDTRTFEKLPTALQAAYGRAEVLKSKHHEHYEVHRCTFLAPRRRAPTWLMQMRGRFHAALSPWPPPALSHPQ